jgi:glycosyltransferase involved in cell wall biosynthesis
MSAAHLTAAPDMVASPLVSVVIPAYNARRWLASAVDSVLTQTYQSVEIIVVDDGSTDGTAGFVASRYPDIVLLRQANRGLSAARNAGLDAARGDFVQFLDADDVLLPAKLEKQVALLQERTSLAGVYCDFQYLESDGGRTASGFDEVGDDRVLRSLLRRNFIVAHAPLLRTAVVRAQNGFDESLTACEDYDLWLRLAAAGHVLQGLREVLVLYRRTPGSMSRDVRRQTEQTWKVLKRLPGYAPLGAVERLLLVRHMAGLLLHRLTRRSPAPAVAAARLEERVPQ